MTVFVDTHCHLDLDVYDVDRDVVLDRALRSGVGAMLLIGFNPERWVTTERLCNRHGFFKRAVGLHPNDAERWDDKLEQMLVAEVQRTKPQAIGEIGLDFFRSSDSKDIQLTAFRSQLARARELDLPVVIHQRAAENEVLGILEEYAPIKGVMHCFSGGPDFARSCLNLGMYLGIGGVVTYPKSDDVRQAVAISPLDRLLLETDAPYLAPQAHRGKRNEPAYLLDVAGVVAEQLRVTLEELAACTTGNAERLFGAQLLDDIQTGTEN